MQSNPYFERLSEAYAVVDGIPEQQITLDIERVSISNDSSSIGVNEGRYIAPANWDTLVLTPDMWLSLCPPYIDVVWPLIENRESCGVEVFWRIDQRLTSRYELAMAHLFNLTPEEAEDLFGMRSDDEIDSGSDKQVFLDRIITFLQEHGEEVTVGAGHIEQDEMLEHGISLPAAGSHNSVAATSENMDAPSGDAAITTPTGFAALALESDTPGAETFDTEAAATAVSPINHEQSVEQGKESTSR